MGSSTTVQQPAETCAARLRQQIALVRTLLDGLDAIVPSPKGVARAQVIEELTRLGCSILDAAAKLSESEDAQTACAALRLALAEPRTRRVREPAVEPWREVLEVRRNG